MFIGSEPVAVPRFLARCLKSIDTLESAESPDKIPVLSDSEDAEDGDEAVPNDDELLQLGKALSNLDTE
eukprot:9109382-Pyramimonas_sp.AAC.1